MSYIGLYVCVFCSNWQLLTVTGGHCWRWRWWCGFSCWRCWRWYRSLAGKPPLSADDSNTDTKRCRTTVVDKADDAGVTSVSRRADMTNAAAVDLCQRWRPSTTYMYTMQPEPINWLRLRLRYHVPLEYADLLWDVRIFSRFTLIKQSLLRALCKPCLGTGRRAAVFDRPLCNADDVSDKTFSSSWH